MQGSNVATAETFDAVRAGVELIATVLEILAVLVIAIVVLGATLVYASRRFSRRVTEATYLQYRHDVARGLLLGLEILVAADVIRTVALEPTLRNVLSLGLLVVIRTFLSWTIVVEIEGRWPWQGSAAAARARSADA